MNPSFNAIEIRERHSDQLKAFVCSKLNHDDSCHDILHDIFIKITEKQERIKLAEKPASYVIKMAQNCIVDYYRAQRKKSSCCNAIDEAITTEKASEYKLADCCLLSFIQKLPPIYSEALSLAEIENVPQKELADRLNIFLYRSKMKSAKSKKDVEEGYTGLLPLSI